MKVLDRASPSVLEGVDVLGTSRPSFALRTAIRHLIALGARMADGPAVAAGHELEIRLPDRQAIRCSVAGPPATPVGRDRAAETIAQAVSGLMAVHGRDAERPRRLGLDVSGTAAGVLAACGLLASLMGRRRGDSVRFVRTSVLDGALAYMRHHLAIATCGKPLPIRPGPFDPAASPVPPFPTADGEHVELEVLSVDAWSAFWARLGVDGRESDDAWSRFALRYLSGTCRLPASLASATAARTAAELGAIARASGLSATRVRRYDEVLADLRQSAPDEADPLAPVAAPWAILPGVDRPRPEALRTGGARPLEGIRVVEATTRLQGPLASQLLQSLGADVVRVEPVGGDIGRTAPGASFRAAYLAYNRGKEVREVDYKQAEGRRALLDLIGSADVFLHNWPNGRAERTGLDWPQLSAINPALIYTHATGWGPEELDDRVGDFAVQAHAGCGDGLNAIGDPPVPTRVTVVDVLGGLIACEGTLAALCARDVTGRGAKVITSLLGAAMTLQYDVLRGILDGHERERRLGRLDPAPIDRPIPTADGYLAVDAVGDDLDRLAASLGCRGGAIDDAVLGRFRDRTSADWIARLRDAGVPAAPVLTDLAAAGESPWVKARTETAEQGSLLPACPITLLG